MCNIIFYIKNCPKIIHQNFQIKPNNLLLVRAVRNLNTYLEFVSSTYKENQLERE